MQYAFLSIVASISIAVAAQDATFTPGQNVYIVAVKSTGQPDISTESKLRKEFEKQKAFKIAPSLQAADFVFLMIVEYEYNQAYVAGVGGVGSEDIKSVAAFAIAPDAYTEHKANLDNLRDQARWRIAENNNAWRTGGLPAKIVKKFHEGTVKKR